MTNTFVSKNDYLDRLYSNGNICLTASKTNNVDVRYRPFLALFSDETFFVDENAKTDKGIRNIIIKFRIMYPTLKELNWKYVSSNFLKEIYLKSQEFDWYAHQYKIPDNLSIMERTNLHKYLKSIKSLRCLSVTNITTNLWYCYFSPDKIKFALFENGYLIIADNYPYIDEFLSNICSIYPQINMIKTLPDYYISATYEQLLYTQQSAREIHIELRKNELQNKYQCTELEALQKLQKIPNQWEKLLFTDEAEARSLIYSNYVRDCLKKKDKYRITRR
ncbi:MAG: hypothetical protein IKW39_03705 [Alphaproteobacteria bacterium]|nr:hypothetical protein [Alphaproteobacteria bacterium]